MTLQACSEDGVFASRCLQSQVPQTQTWFSCLLSTSFPSTPQSQKQASLEKTSGLECK